MNSIKQSFSDSSIVFTPRASAACAGEEDSVVAFVSIVGGLVQRRSVDSRDPKPSSNKVFANNSSRLGLSMASASSDHYDLITHSRTLTNEVEVQTFPGMVRVESEDGQDVPATAEKEEEKIVVETKEASKFVKNMVMFLFIGLGMATRLYPRFIFQTVLVSDKLDGRGAIVLSFLQFASSTMLAYPLCHSTISGHDLIFKHWQSILVPSLFYVAKVITSMAATGTLNVGQDFMTRIVVSLGIIVFDSVVLKKPMEYRVQYLYPLFMVIGCAMYGYDANLAGDSSTGLGIMFGVLERVFTLLYIIWVVFVYDKKINEGIDNMTMLFVESYLGTIVTLILTAATSQFGVMEVLFADTTTSLYSTAFMAIQFLSSIIFFEIISKFKGGKIISVCTDFTRGFVVVSGSFMFPPGPTPLGWAGICISILGSFMFSIPTWIDESATFRRFRLKKIIPSEKMEASTAHVASMTKVEENPSNA